MMLSQYQIRILATPLSATRAELSKLFGVSQNTIKYHVKVINRILQTPNLFEAKLLARQRGIVQDQQ